MLNRATLAVLALLAPAAAAFAQAPAGVETRTVDYTYNGTTYRGYLAMPTTPIPAELREKGDDDDDDDRPAVLVVHEWWGLNDYTKRRTEQLAQLGYVAFAVDVFGEGKTTDDAAVAKSWAGPLYIDRQEFRRRLEAGLEKLEDIDGVDDDRIAAIGYCFGGTAVLELAYSESDEDDDLRGVVSFHGSPMPPLEADRRVHSRVLLLHGGDDPMVKTTDVEAVATAIKTRQGDARVVVYPDAVHSFTNPDADAKKLDGVAYNEAADKASWDEMQKFLLEVLKDDD